MNNDSTIVATATTSNFQGFEWFIIICIIGIQAYLLYSTIKRINIFKNIIPNLGAYKISKVIIPKQHLDYLEPSQILSEIKKYPTLDESSDEIHTEFNRYITWGQESNDSLIKAKQTVQAFIEHRVSNKNDELKTKYLSFYDLGVSPEEALKKAKNSVSFGRNKQLDFLEVPLIISNKENNEEFLSINHSLNSYLLRNKGSISDFNVMKDVVERNCDSIDEEINTSLPIPLYLGLMGTMIGIVIGLFNLPSIGSADFLNGSGIDILIGGVKVAMLASLAGLFITVINSGVFYKGCKAEVERKKNDFYSFLQAELLPVLSKDTLSVIHTLRDNLEVFNTNFKNNISGFDTAINDIQGIFNGQIELLRELKEIDVAQIAKLNVNVLKELRKSAEEFEKFNIYINQLNGFIQNVYGLNTKFNELLERTGNFEHIASNISIQTDKGVRLQEFLNTHFSVLELHGANVQHMATDLDKVMSESLDQLKLHTFNQIESIKETTVVQNTEFRKFLEETEKTYYQLLHEKKGNLDYLKNLEVIKNNSESLKESLNLNILSSELGEIRSLLEQQNLNSKKHNSPKKSFWNKVKDATAISFFILGTIVLLGFLIDFFMHKILPFLIS